MKHSAIYDAGLSLPGTLYLLQQLNQRGELRSKEIMNKDVYSNKTLLCDRLNRTQRNGLVKRNVKNVPGEKVIIKYAITEAGKEVIPHLEEIEKIMQKAKINLSSSNTKSE